jgi:hypothetical protein
MSYERKNAEPKAPAPTINDLVEASPHNLELQENVYRCLDCSGAVSKSSPTIKNWLKAKCSALPFDDRKQMVPIPMFHVVQIGNTIPHSTHTLSSYRGIICCTICGAYGVKKCKLLADVCKLHCTESTQLALDNLRLGLLPASCKAWPRCPNLGVWQAPVVLPTVLSFSDVPLLATQSGTIDDVFESSDQLPMEQARLRTTLDDSDLEFFDEDAA